MALTEQINEDIKVAMKARDAGSLDALRAIKSALLLAATEKGADGKVSDDAGIKVLQKLVKQRKEAAEIYLSQKRDDLAHIEMHQAAIIERYLPSQMTAIEIESFLRRIITEMGVTGIADLGKVMGVANKALAGKAEGKTIAEMTRKLLGA